MAGRVIAIGDVHGCADALAALIDAIKPTPSDTVITLGDHLDRGPNSRGVIDQLLTLGGRCRLIPLLGNHEEVLLDALRDREHLPRWLKMGGTDTLRSYGWVPGGSRRALADWFPPSHRRFFNDCRSWHETSTHLFVHAGYEAELPLAEQPPLALRWRVTSRETAQPLASGNVAIVGHTPQLSGEVLDLGFLVCLDTGAVRRGWLTAMDVASGRIWQANRGGRLRSPG